MPLQVWAVRWGIEVFSLVMSFRLVFVVGGVCVMTVETFANT
jgi:hypothetical protein